MRRYEHVWVQRFGQRFGSVLDSVLAAHNAAKCRVLAQLKRHFRAANASLHVSLVLQVLTRETSVWPAGRLTPGHSSFRRGAIWSSTGHGVKKDVTDHRSLRSGSQNFQKRCKLVQD